MRILLSSAFAVALLALCGCGGSKSSTTSITSTTAAKTTHAVSTASGTQPTGAELIKRADAICARSNARIAHTPGQVEKVSDYATVAVPRAAIYHIAVVELEKLTAPTSVAEAWRQLLASRRALANALQALGNDARAGNVRAVQALLKSSTEIHSQIAASAIKVGATQCANIN